MRSLFRGFAGLLLAGTIIFFCSCDKHPLGEWPEVQKEHVNPASEAKAESSTGEPTKSGDAEATPTPAEFFPEKKYP